MGCQLGTLGGSEYGSYRIIYGLFRAYVGFYKAYMVVSLNRGTSKWTPKIL